MDNKNHFKKRILRLEEVSKKYVYGNEEIEVLKKIEIEIFEKDLIAIVGPSGVGKTTLLNIMGTLDKPTSGNVYFYEKKLDFNKEEELLEIRRKMIGFVFQFHHLLPEFNVIENVILPGVIYGLRKEDCIKRAEELLQKLGLSHRKTHKPSSLSGGERQRVAIARALFLNPQLLLADEPTGNLDPNTAKEVIEVFMKINDEFNTAVVVATHNLELASKMEKIFLIKNGFLIKLDRKNFFKGLET